MALSADRKDQNSASNAELRAALETLSKDRLVDTLFDVCMLSPEAFKVCELRLLVKSLVASDLKRKRASLGTDGPPVKVQKRFEWCMQCGEEYDVLDNEAEECSEADSDIETVEHPCQWHSGGLPQY